MPTLKEMREVYQLPEETDPTYDYKKSLLLWYTDHYLPVAAGLEYYGPTIRYYKMAIEATKVEGVKTHLVTKESEAMGLLMYENCLEKWKEIVDMKSKDPDWKVPDWNKEDEDTWKYHKTQWSDGKSGQVAGGGWKPAAYTAFNKYIGHFKKFRAEDKKNKWVIHKLCLQMMREANEITATVYSKKRSRSKKDAAPAPIYDDIEELSDDFSVHSEGSAD